VEWWTIVVQRLQAYGAFDGCTAEDRRTIMAQAYMVVVHLTAGEEGRLLYLTHLCPLVDRTRDQTVLDSMARLCPEIIAAVQASVATWRARCWQG
jgi:hypothetical protein